MDLAVAPLRSVRAANTVTWARWAEFAGAFLVLPILIGFVVAPPWWMPCLWAIAVGAWALLQQHRHSRVRRYAARPDPSWRRKEIRDIFRRFAFCAAGLSVFVLVFMPSRFLAWPRQMPLFWLAVVVLYPLLSVIPQEFVYRRFFFNRYGALFRTRLQLALASALVFAWMHLIFRNEWALLMTFVGGLLFADTYRKTHSLLLVTLEHTLYGVLVFTIGLGDFIYHGAVG
jgi:uncharacterized protein